jgi:cleavage and polyadenylation specificity factor subunit 1
VYIDDILVASETREEHKKHLRKLFKRLDEYGIQLNPAKCTFAEETVAFLGYQVSTNGIRPLQEKVEAIEKFIRPSNVKQLRQFLGVVNFYRRCIPGAAKEQALLNEELRGNKKGKAQIEWTDELEQAFNACKNSLSRAALLAHPDPTCKWTLTTDASEVAIGAVVQQHKEATVQPLAFLSKKLTTAQKKYSPYDRELLAIYSAVKHFRHLLEEREFTVFTDHKPLTYALQKDPSQSSPRQARHLEYIAQFTTDIRYVFGTENTVVDTLSRVETV